MNAVYFIRDAVATVTSGSRTYHLWMSFLTLLVLIGGYAYWIQLDEGLAVTGMHDHVSWGLYISNFTFRVAAHHMDATAIAEGGTLMKQQPVSHHQRLFDLYERSETAKQTGGGLRLLWLER